MHTNSERLLEIMLNVPMDDARSAFITRSRVESGRIKDKRAWLLKNGFEPVVAAKGDLLTADGRVVFWVRGKAFALTKDRHEERLAVSLAASRPTKPEPETKSVAGTEALSSMVCPKCGDSLQHTTVCPKCAAGKLGYRHRYTCVCGGVDLVSKEAL